ncbi:MAG: hypothetical protein JSV77_10340 [Dehalococcoidales bacterium]|nr:MAG: hypothetical protein JSV77_10340 [Dehalococcoidales bacterium]
MMPVSMDKIVTLTVGEGFHLKRGKDRIAYAGMPSEYVYSIVQIKASGYQGYSWNLYFPRRKQDITIDGVNLYVENVTPEVIRFRVQ